MKILVCVNNAPHFSPGGRSALEFTRAALEQGHQVPCVFFYHDGVLTGSGFASLPADQQDLTAAWQQLAAARSLDLVLCIGAAMRRGILDDAGAIEQLMPAANLASGFRIAGLGQWMDAVVLADRVVRFGTGGL